MEEFDFLRHPGRVEDFARQSSWRMATGWGLATEKLSHKAFIEPIAIRFEL
ncbi:hypothetical protein IQ250_05640 [Pseudanabaenaceae cyanobacterium LEGE 13415]|nr:hypothetical protein [Pseudanabaenaceae cyanobacterium LEGE 13415]